MLNNLFRASFFKYIFSASVAASNIDFAEMQLICAERPQLCKTLQQNGEILGCFGKLVAEICFRLEQNISRQRPLP